MRAPYITCNKQTRTQSRQANKLQTSKERKACKQTNKQKESVFARNECRFGFGVRRSIELNYGRHTFQQAKLLKVNLRILCIETGVLMTQTCTSDFRA